MFKPLKMGFLLLAAKHIPTIVTGLVIQLSTANNKPLWNLEHKPTSILLFPWAFGSGILPGTARMPWSLCLGLQVEMAVTKQLEPVAGASVRFAGMSKMAFTTYLVLSLENCCSVWNYFLSTRLLCVASLDFLPAWQFQYCQTSQMLILSMCNEKWKLLVLLKIYLWPVIASFPLNSIGQRSHRPTRFSE